MNEASAGNRFGAAILHRIGWRERTRALTQCLRLVGKSPLGGQLIFLGSAALNGVYGNGERLSKDLDFIGMPDAIEQMRRFPESVCEQFSLQPDAEGNWQPAYCERGTVYEKITVTIDVQPRYEQKELPHERRDWRNPLTGETVSVLVQPLGWVLGIKFDCLRKRAKATDFVDVWHGLSRHGAPGADAVREYLRFRRNTWRFKSAVAVEKLDAFTQGDWHESLAPSMRGAVPPLETVRRDLRQWLQTFDDALL